MYFTVLLTICFVAKTYCQTVPTNPCREIFSYKRGQNGLYHGEIIVPYDDKATLNLAVNVSMAGLYKLLVSFLLFNNIQIVIIVFRN